MAPLNPNFVTDANNKKVAVQLNIKTYNKIEEILENYGLYRLMEESDDEKSLDLNEAKKYYARLKKAK